MGTNGDGKDKRSAGHRLDHAHDAARDRKRRRDDPQFFDHADISKLIAELADTVGIPVSRATAVFKVFDLVDLVANINSARRMFWTERALLELNVPPKAAKQAAKDVRAFRLKLGNLRLSTRIAPVLEADPEDPPGIAVCKVSLLVQTKTSSKTWAFGHNPDWVCHELSGLSREHAETKLPELTEGDLDRMADDLAARVAITGEQARDVLLALKLPLLIEHINTARDLIANPDAICALGLSASAISQAVEDSARFAFEIDSLRLATRKGALTGSATFLQELMKASRQQMIGISRGILARQPADQTPSF